MIIMNDTEFYKELCKDRDFMEYYRTEESWVSSNDVFPIQLGEDKLVIKRPSRFPKSQIQDLVYNWQSFPFEVAEERNVRSNLKYEAELLKTMAGNVVPGFIFFDEDTYTLIRSYVDGTDFRQLQRTEDRAHALEKGLDSLEIIHDKFGFLGSAHAKNIILGNDGKAYWTGAEYNERISGKGKMEDILKFVFSIYAATKDVREDERRWLVLESARLSGCKIRQNMRLEDFENYFNRINGSWSEFRWWYSTRMPADLREKVKRTLKGH